MNKLINTEYGSPLKDAVGSAILGKENFIREIKEKYLSGKMADKDIPAIRALADRVSAEALYSEAEKIFSDDPVLLRNMKIYLAKRFTEKAFKGNR